MRFHGVLLGNQHEMWSKQHNGKVSSLPMIKVTLETHLSLPSPHAGVILFRQMRSGDMRTEQERLSFMLHAYVEDLHHFLVVSPTSVRVRKTPRQKAA
jgi:hypothetical protein